jgi:hypothetical protein
MAERDLPDPAEAVNELWRAASGARIRSSAFDLLQAGQPRPIRPEEWRGLELVLVEGVDMLRLPPALPSLSKITFEARDILNEWPALGWPRRR